MQTKPHIWRFFLAGLLLGALLIGNPRNAFAEEASASLSSPTTYVGKSIEITLSVKEARSAKAPETINVPGLQIKLHGRSTKFEMKEFKVTSHQIFTYKITPEKTGDFSIPPIEVEVEGRVLKSNPLRFAVSSTPGDSPVPKENQVAFDEATKTKACSGDADAQLKLAEIYFKGIGISKDEVEAFKWFKKSAEQGNASAQERSGWCYSNGFGVPKDDAEAVRCFRAATNQGNDLAKFHLGLCYLKGQGVPKNPIEAYALLNIAGMNDENARNERDALAKSMTEEQVALAQKRSKELLVEFSAQDKKPVSVP